jgi:hypothetical protein
MLGRCMAALGIFLGRMQEICMKEIDKKIGRCVLGWVKEKILNFEKILAYNKNCYN